MFPALQCKTVQRDADPIGSNWCGWHQLAAQHMQRYFWGAWPFMILWNTCESTGLGHFFCIMFNIFDWQSYTEMDGFELKHIDGQQIVTLIFDNPKFVKWAQCILSFSAVASFLWGLCPLKCSRKKQPTTVDLGSTFLEFPHNFPAWHHCPNWEKTKTFCS